MSDKDKKVDPLTEDQLNQKEAELQQLEKTLNEEKEAFEKEKSDFEEEKKNFETEKSEFEVSKAALEIKQSDLDELEKTLMEVGTETEAEEPEPGLEFTYDKENFKFTDEAPKRILLANGKKMTQKEIVKDKEALASIINGSLIKRIK